MQQELKSVLMWALTASVDIQGDNVQDLPNLYEMLTSQGALYL